MSQIQGIQAVLQWNPLKANVKIQVQAIIAEAALAARIIAMLVLAQAVTGERITEDHGAVVYGSGASVDCGLATWMLFWLLVLFGVVSWDSWEALKTGRMDGL